MEELGISYLPAPPLVEVFRALREEEEVAREAVDRHLAAYPPGPEPEGRGVDWLIHMGRKALQAWQEGDLDQAYRALRAAVEEDLGFAFGEAARLAAAWAQRLGRPQEAEALEARRMGYLEGLMEGIALLYGEELVLKVGQVGQDGASREWEAVLYLDPEEGGDFVLRLDELGGSGLDSERLVVELSSYPEGKTVMGRPLLAAAASGEGSGRLVVQMEEPAGWEILIEPQDPITALVRVRPKEG